MHSVCAAMKKNMSQSRWSPESIQRLSTNNQTEAYSWQQLTPLTSGRWEVVGQPYLQCICELQSDWFNSSSSAAFCVQEVEFTPPKINFVCINGCRNFVCINGCRNKWKTWIALQYAGTRMRVTDWLANYSSALVYSHDSNSIHHAHSHKWELLAWK